MNIAELFKKNFVLVPVIASVLFGTFTGVKYVVNLTDTINARDLAYEQEKMADVKTRLASAEATWTMAENLYNVLANTVREQGYDIKDVARDLLNDY
jgi:membrane protein required for beta-lactamase induction